MYRFSPLEESRGIPKDNCKSIIANKSLFVKSYAFFSVSLLLMGKKASNITSLQLVAKFMAQVVSQLFLFWQQVVDQLVQIPWGHNIAIIQKCKNTLPPLQSDLAREITKDPYNFDFLTLTQGFQEKELEDALCENMTKFLLELGSGFSFVGRQYRLTVGSEEFRIDLLFYHIKLKCYVVVELKVTEFKPEYAGKLSFYTSAIDGEIKEANDNPTIGILICKSKNNIVVEYALKDIHKPLGISEYELTEILPKEYKSSLPSIEQIEASLDVEMGSDDE
jgi:predicted nuclease of restriction endonuclease-like (RecB) superfamily